MKLKRVFLLTIAMTVTLLTTTAFKLLNIKESNYKPLVNPVCQDANYLMGVRVDTLSMTYYSPKRGESFKTVLLRNGVSANQYERIRRAARQEINLNYSIAGLPVTLLKDDQGDLRYVFLEKNYSESVILDLNPEQPEARIENKDIITHERNVAGVINGDLYSTFKDLNIPRKMIYRIDKIFNGTVRVNTLRDGDTIRLRYQEQIIDGEVKKVSDLEACILSIKGKRYYAFYYKKPGDDKGAFYDEHGNSFSNSFLKMPVKNGRISSHFSMHRFHPILKRWKSHLGTDFAAPYGTPIMATADGVIQEATSSTFNGKYVKIKHNNIYTSQYLHMSKIGKGIRPGKRVKQGDIIGYVGSSGLATGPHVCYRFWKNGVQVDPFKQKLNFKNKLDAQYMTKYLAYFRNTDQKLCSIQPINLQDDIRGYYASNQSVK